MTRRVANK